MKKLFTAFSCMLVCTLTTPAQELEGFWKGVYEENYDNVDDIYSYPIELYFRLMPDGAYEVYSYSKGRDARGKDTVIVCKVAYQLAGPDSVLLQELWVLMPQYIAPTCLQTFHLQKIRQNNRLELKGTWDAKSDNCGSGPVRFIQERKKKKRRR